MKIHHVSLPGGQVQVAPRAALNEKVLARTTAWLEQMLATGERQPLVFSGISHFSASAEEHNDALLVTIWSPAGSWQPVLPYQGKSEMFSSFGVAPDKAGGEIFWTSLRDAQAMRAVPRHAAVWCQGLTPDTRSAVRPEAFDWLPDLQSAIASSWLRRATASPQGMVVRLRTS